MQRSTGLLVNNMLPITTATQ